MARHHGSKGSVSMNSIVVASLNKWSLNMKRDNVNVTCFGDTNKVYVRGLPDIQGNYSGVYDPSAASPDDGNTPLFEAAMGEAAVTLKLTPTTSIAGDYAQGSAYIDSMIDVDANGAITIGGSYVAAAAWSLAGAMAG